MNCSILKSLSEILKGDSILGGWHDISTTTLVGNTHARVEIRGIPWLSGRVTDVKVSPITLTTSVSQGKLDLNNDRFIYSHGFDRLHNPIASGDLSKNHNVIADSWTS